MAQKQSSLILESKDMQRKLLNYATAAGLALTAGLALNKDAVLAGVKYYDPEPDFVLPDDSANFGIDFDRDGDHEFILKHSNPYNNYLYAYNHSDYGQDVGLSVLKSDFFARVLDSAVSITSAIGTWGSPPAPIAFANAGSTNAGFANTENKFLALKFNLDGSGPYYGFVKLSCANHATSCTVHYHAYEATQGEGITTTANPTAVTLSNLEASTGATWALPTLGAAIVAVIVGAWAGLRKKLGLG